METAHSLGGNVSVAAVGSAPVRAYDPPVAVRQSIAGKGATVKSSLEIAQDHRMQPIVDIAAAAGLSEDEIELYGRYKAKIELSAIERLSDRPDAKIVNVTAITPTPAGEGKTTTSVALAQGLGHIGRKPILCLREPSLGPIFGVKGGALIVRSTSSSEC